MSNEIKFLRLLIGETSYKDFNTLYQMLKLTARDRSVQRESVWRNESGNKQGEYLSNVAIGYGKTAILHIIDIEANVEYLKGICNSAREQRYIDRLEEQKALWSGEASKLPSYEEFLKQNYYD